MNFRTLHRKTAPVLFLPLLLTALTGVAYRIGRAWFGLPDSIAEGLLAIHEGRFLGKPLVPIYVLLMGLGLVSLIATGLIMLIKRRATTVKPRWDQRWVHRLVGMIAILPLTLSATTGIIYRLSRTWFGLETDQVGIFLSLHEGRYFGTVLQPLYVLLVGVGLILLLVTGIRMTGIFRRSRPT